MQRVTIYTSRLTDRDKKTAQEEISKGNMVRIYPTCMNQGRRDIVRYQGEKFLEELGAKPVNDESVVDEEYLFFKV